MAEQLEHYRRRFQSPEILACIAAIGRVVAVLRSQPELSDLHPGLSHLSLTLESSGRRGVIFVSWHRSEDLFEVSTMRRFPDALHEVIVPVAEIKGKIVEGVAILESGALP